MDNQVLPTTDLGLSFPMPPIGNRESPPATNLVPNEIVTRGVGRCLEKYFPHLLKNIFNRVLLVDEDPEIHIQLDQVLTSSGYTVQHTISEIDAIQIIKDNPPDFLIINWKKAASSTTPFYESLRRGFIDGYLYIIVMTTEDLVRNKVQISASGADAYVLKPVQAGELLSLLQSGIRIIEQQLQQKEQAMHDPLTGLLNRRTFSALQKHEWNRTYRHKETVSCAMIDVDFFKNINDVYGQIHGNRVLCRIGEIMKSIGRKSDILCRYDGDAFCIYMPNTDMQGALICAERFRVAVEQEKQFFEEAGSFPTVTVGVATKTDDMDIFESLLEKAEQSLLWGKQNGRNSVAGYDLSQAAIVAFRENA
jgi:two-component system, cell cycle response regulator